MFNPRRIAAERAAAAAGPASDHCDTLPFDASPIAKSLSRESFATVADSPETSELCKSLSADFRSASVETPGPVFSI